MREKTGEKKEKKNPNHSEHAVQLRNNLTTHCVSAKIKKERR